MVGERQESERRLREELTRWTSAQLSEQEKMLNEKFNRSRELEIEKVEISQGYDR